MMVHFHISPVDFELSYLAIVIFTFVLFLIGPESDIFIELLHILGDHPVEEFVSSWLFFLGDIENSPVAHDGQHFVNRGDLWD